MRRIYGCSMGVYVAYLRLIPLFYSTRRSSRAGSLRRPAHYPAFRPAVPPGRGFGRPFCGHAVCHHALACCIRLTAPGCHALACHREPQVPSHCGVFAAFPIWKCVAPPSQQLEAPRGNTPVHNGLLDPVFQFGSPVPNFAPVFQPHFQHGNGTTSGFSADSSHKLLISPERRGTG